MNFLAHLHLSTGTPASMLGGVVADLMKPREISLLPDDVQAGVRLHRQIDAFTDSHALVRRSIGRIAADWHWFSGIIIDVYYDHLLARDWSCYSDEPLPHFAARCYQVLADGRSLLTPDAAEFLSNFIASDRLLSYATDDGIAETLGHLSNRIARRMPKHVVRLEDAMPMLRTRDAGLAADFHAFYPELMAFAGDVRTRP